MGAIPPDIANRAKSYCDLNGIGIEMLLGSGIQGVVYSTTEKTAIKTFVRPEHYERERDVYLRLQDKDFSVVGGFNVPKLLGLNDELLVVEMEVVTPPFVLDFAGAYLDRRPPYDSEELAEWEETRIELFGDDWPRVRNVLAMFRAIGVHLVDVKPGNVTIRD